MRNKSFVILFLCLTLAAIKLLEIKSPLKNAATPRARAQNKLPTPNARIVESYGKLPLSFEANQGQTDPAVKFLSQGSGYSLFLTANEAVLSLRESKGSASVPLAHGAAE